LIQFPLLQGLFVRSYGLYPGRRGKGRLAMKMGRGPWMILGVNGLGKSTLLLIIRHMLAGPNRVANAGPSGTARSDVVPIDKRIFAGRVSDGARTSTATLMVKFGASFFVITRRLDDLTLVCCKSPGQVIEAGPEAEGAFQRSIASAMGLGTFDDALRVFRYMNFVLEDRDALIWDPKAQSEIFRAVFLPPERSARWRMLEGEIISADSGARNFSAALYKIIQRQERERQRSLTAPQVRAKLAALARDQDRDEALEVEKRRLRESAEDRRIDARDSARLKEQGAEEKKRDYERLKFHAIRQALAEVSPSEQYILIKIISEHKCAACGNDAHTLAISLEERRRNNLCLICGQSKIKDEGIISSQEFSEERASRAYEVWTSSDSIARKARDEFSESEMAYNKVSLELAELRRTIDFRNRDIRHLQKQLPADERQTGREYDEVASLRARINEYRAERDAAEVELSDLLGEARSSVESVRSRIEAQFAQRASDFLLESFRLVYAPDRRVVGQTGRSLDFPAFEVELTSGATDGKSVRRSADQVSLSQREYLDLAFRMAVMDVVATGPSTLVIDGPEGSVDAVFARRAGDLLASYSRDGEQPGNRVLVACNLVDTPLIPSMLVDYPMDAKREGRVVNLLTLAAPTAAVVHRRQEYDDAYNRVLSGRLFGDGG
jgi:hypothetical protein